jgi:predicted lipoprotein
VKPTADEVETASETTAAPSTTIAAPSTTIAASKPEATPAPVSLKCKTPAQIATQTSRNKLLEWDVAENLSFEFLEVSLVAMLPANGSSTSSSALAVTGSVSRATATSLSQFNYVGPATINADYTVQITPRAKQTHITYEPCIVKVGVLGVVGVESGLRAEVYRIPQSMIADSTKNRLADLTKLTPIVDSAGKQLIIRMPNIDVPPRKFDLGFPGHPELEEWFALRITGKIVAPTTGRYTFYTIADDGIRVYIDGNEVLTDDELQAPDSSPASKSFDMTQGEHNIEVRWFQGPRNLIAMQLFWKVPGTNNAVIVPDTSFKP